MIRIAMAVVLTLLTVRAHRSAAQREESALARARARFALGFLLLSGALIPLGFPGSAALRAPLLALAAVAGAVAWEASAQLLAALTRKRDVPARAFWLGVAAITLATPAPWGVAASFALMGSLAFRWRHAVPTRRKYALVLAAIALAAIGYFRISSLGGAEASALPDWQQQLWAVGNALRLALAMLSSVAAYVLLLAIVRDPSLGIRGVGRRLGLSHSLVLLVPVALLLALWAATTVLGVQRDRALNATHTLAAETAQLRAALSGALHGGEAGVTALAASWNGAAPGTRAFLVRRGVAVRAAGDALADGEIAAAAWVDSLATLTGASMVSVAGGKWLGAAAREGDLGAVLLVPADTLVRRLTGAQVGGVSRLSSGPRGVSVADSAGRAAYRRATAVPPADSTDGEAAEDTSSANQLHTSISVGRNQYSLDEQNLSVRQLLLHGHSFTPVIEWRRGAWDRAELMLSIELGPREVLRGMFETSENDAMGFVPLILLVMLGVLMALVAFSDILMVTNMGRGVATAIGALSEAARKLERGDLTHRIELRGDDDLWEVARAVNQAAEGLEKAQAAEKDRARMESELAVARRIQSRLLPAAAPRIPGLEIAGTSQPALEVGGDYFDHIDMGDGRVALVIADVSGKGVPAALLMSAFRAALVSHDLRREEPAALAERLNDFLHRSVDPGKFVTAFIAFLDSATGELQFVNAGHNPSLLTRADGTHEWLSEGGTILGILPMSVFTAGRVTLQTGDVLTLYTDGVTEGADATKEQWGEDRLVAALQRLREKPCAEIARALVTEVRTFEGDSGPADDITVIVARRA